MKIKGYSIFTWALMSIGLGFALLGVFCTLVAIVTLNLVGILCWGIIALLGLVILLNDEGVNNLLNEHFKD